MAKMNRIDSQANRKFDQDALTRELDIKNKRLALQIWRVANGGVFLFFVLANSLMRQTQVSWPPAGVPRLSAGIPIVITLFLLLSSWTASRVQAAMKKDDVHGVQQNTLFTLALGVAFLIGIAMVWQQTQPGGSYTAIFYTMTGFHAVHVLAGMLLFGYVYWKAQQHKYTATDHWSLEATVVFWHFVDLMWLIYFVVLYIF
jgi:cytochrome c oxidase subunit 3